LEKTIFKTTFIDPYLDLMGDGMQELVVVSLTGVHILQHDIQLGAEKILPKLCRAFSNDSSLYDNSYYTNTSGNEKDREIGENRLTQDRDVIDVSLSKVTQNEDTVDNSRNNENVKRGI